MKHTNISLKTWGNVAQRLLSKNQKSSCSDVINVMSFYGGEYAEQVYQRIKDSYHIKPILKEYI